MKLDVEMYVRTKNHNGFPGGIGKIEKIQDDEKHKTSWITLDRSLDGRSFLVMKQEIVKASHTLLGNDKEPCLIELGDYVNGNKVIEIEKNYKFIDGTIRDILWTDTKMQKAIWDETIKSIVTKEQFEQMEYKVEE